MSIKVITCTDNRGVVLVNPAAVSFVRGFEPCGSSDKCQAEIGCFSWTLPVFESVDSVKAKLGWEIR
jgi:hypothetical protein